MKCVKSIDMHELSVYMHGNESIQYVKMVYTCMAYIENQIEVYGIYTHSMVKKLHKRTS